MYLYAMNLVLKKSIVYKYLFVFIAILFSFVVPQPLESALRSASKIMPFSEDSPELLYEKGNSYQNKEQLDSALICYSWLSEIYRDSQG